MQGKAGWLNKQGGRIKSWKKRYFVLEGPLAQYYSKPNESLKGSIDLSDATSIDADTECKRQPAIKIVTPKRTFLIQANSESDRQDWIEAFRNAKSSTSAINTAPSSTPSEQNAVANSQASQANNQTSITVDDFEYIRVLGRGTFGKVQLVKFKRDGQIYTMKSMKKEVLQEHEHVEQSIVERDIYIKTRHPFLVSAHYSFQTPESIFLILDYVPGGELFERLKQESKFDEPRAKLYAAEIMLALGHLHSLKLIFRDLKPENILLDENGHIKLTDFGLVKTNMGADDSTSTFCGTPEYIAPEMLQQQPYTKSVDWWSFGILLYEMLTGLPPFYDSNTSKMYRKILSDDLEIPSFISDECADFIRKLLDRDPQTRLGSSERDYEELKEHPFFKEYDWDAILAKRIQPQWKPVLHNETDTSNFDSAFTEQRAGPSYANAAVLTPNTQSSFVGFTCTDPSAL